MKFWWCSYNRFISGFCHCGSGVSLATEYGVAVSFEAVGFFFFEPGLFGFYFCVLREIARLSLDAADLESRADGRAYLVDGRSHCTGRCGSSALFICEDWIKSGRFHIGHSALIGGVRHCFLEAHLIARAIFSGFVLSVGAESRGYGADDCRPYHY